MGDIDRLISLSMEIEGFLRVIANRDSQQARNLLQAKVDQFNALYSKSFAGQEFDGDGLEIVNEIEIKRSENEKAGAIAALGSALAAAKGLAEGDDDNDDDDDAPDSDEITIDDNYLELSEAANEPVVDDDLDIAGTLEPVGPVEHNERLIGAFTLNDSFRFCRELFDGNQDDFRDTLEVLADMPDLAEAQDYLYNDLMWNPDDPDVKDFMGILENNMNA